MRPAETATRLTEFADRGAGSDAERRAAQWLAREFEQAGHDVRIEPFWCRANWAFAHSWHLGLALVGSLVSVSSARVGGALILIALLSIVADDLTGFSPGRRLTPERASQNVIASRTGEDDSRVHLIITANYDAGRTGLVYRDRLRRATAAMRRATGGLLPGWLGWLVIVLVWLLAVAILRLEGAHGTGLGVLQLPPTVVLVIGLALLLELTSTHFGPAANDNASGVAAAVALHRAVDAAPPHNLVPELVLTGAGDGGIGLRRYLRARRRVLRATNVVVIGLAPSGAGDARWWLSDGQLVPLRYFTQIQTLLAQIVEDDPAIGARPHRGRGATPALPARAARLPAIAIGCLDERGLAPRSHQPSDTADRLDPAAIDAIVELGLILVDAIDGYIARTRAPASPQGVTPA